MNYVFLAPGFEEMEAAAPIDILRRAQMPVTTVSILADTAVVGAHGIPFIADTTIDRLAANIQADWLILPGGMPGAQNLVDCEKLRNMLLAHKGNIAAVCASPAVILGTLGLLNGVKATCYPGMENWQGLSGIDFTGCGVVRHGRFVTAKGPAFALDFALEIVRATLGEKTADELSQATLRTPAAEE